jgi:Arc/MetJ-type ribon-helix-helix transcriptional regulator
MERKTIHLPEDLIESLEEEAGEYDVSFSAYVRELVQDGREYDDLRDRLESREARIEELEEQLAKRSNVEEKIDTLVKADNEPEPPFFIEWYRFFAGG